MADERTKPLGAREGCRFSLAVGTLSVVMLGLAIFGAWQVILPWGFLRGYFGVGARPQA